MITFAFHLVLTLIFTFAFDFTSNLRLRIETNEILPVPLACAPQQRGPDRNSKENKGNKGSTNPKQGNPTLNQDLLFALALAYSKAREARVANVLKIKTNATFSCCPHRIWCLGLLCYLYSYLNFNKNKNEMKSKCGVLTSEGSTERCASFPTSRSKKQGQRGLKLQSERSQKTKNKIKYLCSMPRNLCPFARTAKARVKLQSKGARENKLKKRNQ